MNDVKLEKALTLLADKPLPDCPDSVETNVLRKIRLTYLEHNPTESANLWDLLTRPVFMATLCAFTIVLSAATTYIMNSSPVSLENRKQLASAALDFNAIKQHSMFTFDEETFE